MDKNLKQRYWNLIIELADKLNELQIPYHFDASTSLFVHGIDFDMDDIDIMVEWNSFEKSHEYFMDYGAEPVMITTFFQFYVTMDGLPIHFLSSPRALNFSNDAERVQIIKEKHVIWSKSIEFYRRNHSDDHPLAGLIDDYLKKRVYNDEIK